MARTETTKGEFKYEDTHVKLSDITVHPYIQRRFSQPHAEKILQKFDPAILRPLAIIKNGAADRFWLIDGQHSMWAVREWIGKDWEGQQVQCRLYKVATDAEAAQLCDRLNSNMKRWTALDKFRNLVTARDRTATNIVALLEVFGLRIGKTGTKSDGEVIAVTALQSIYDRDDGRLLKSTLALINQAWGHSSDAYDAVILQGVALFLQRHGKAIDVEAFAKKLAKSLPPLTLIGDARARARMDRSPVRESCCQKLAREYNVGLRSNKLPV